MIPIDPMEEIRWRCARARPQQALSEVFEEPGKQHGLLDAPEHIIGLHQPIVWPLLEPKARL